MSWQQYVQTAQGLGFSKVTIINRKTYQPLGYTNQAHIATAWMEGDKQINENQELLNDWKKPSSFCFYGQRFNIVLRDDEDSKWIVCMKGKEVCIGYQFNTVWFIVYGLSKSKGKKSNDNENGFSGAPDAFNKIMSGLFDALEEAGV